MSPVHTYYHPIFISTTRF